MWCPDQAKGVNVLGETTLHAIALDNNPKLLYPQVVRGVNPLTLTMEREFDNLTRKGGQSVLLYAVKNIRCPQKMVAECIRLGFSTQQPALTQQKQEDIALWFTRFILNEGYRFIISSPLLLAMVRGRNVVAHMLYESGSCSPTELLHLYEQLLELSDPDTDSGRQLLESINQPIRSWRYDQTELLRRYQELTKNILTFLPCLKQMVSTPRSLKSTCRLVISRCLTVHRRRERAILQLTLPVRTTTGDLDTENEVLPELELSIKNYLLFSDLTDPDYAPHWQGKLSCTPAQQT
jgi:hypothetical protein